MTSNRRHDMHKLVMLTLAGLSLGTLGCAALGAKVC